MLLMIAILSSISLTGCAGSDWPDREGFVRSDGVHVIHVPGIMGEMGMDQLLARGLIRAGVQEVRLHDWTGSLPLRNLSDERRHEEQAQRLVEEIHKLHRDLPDARICITAHSGGTKIALSALEIINQVATKSQNPDHPIVDQLWLFAPAVRPGYDLEPASNEVNEIIVVCSKKDWFILGIGTRLFGAADRFYSDSAGRTGFTFSDGNPKVHQWFYESEWRKYKYTGSHLSSLSEPFIAFIVAPYMLEKPPIWNDP